MTKCFCKVMYLIQLAIIFTKKWINSFRLSWTPLSNYKKIKWQIKDGLKWIRMVLLASPGSAWNVQACLLWKPVPLNIAWPLHIAKQFIIKIAQFRNNILTISIGCFKIDLFNKIPLDRLLMSCFKELRLLIRCINSILWGQ